MKKFYCLFAIMVLLLSSCSEDGVSSEYNIDGTLLKRATLTYNGGANVITSDFFYNGSKLSHIIASEGRRIIYFYTGDLITRMEYHKHDGLESVDLLEYDDNENLIERRQITNNTGYKVIYTYNADGTVSVAAFTGDAIAQNTPTDLNKKVFFTDGMLTRIDDYKMIDGNLEAMHTNYSFDTAMSPFTQIIGYDKLTFYEMGAPPGLHNLTSITFTTSVNSNTDVDEIVNTYNGNNYLSKAIHVDGGDNGGDPMIFEYFYE